MNSFFKIYLPNVFLICEKEQLPVGVKFLMHRSSRKPVTCSLLKLDKEFALAQAESILEDRETVLAEETKKVIKRESG